MIETTPVCDFCSDPSPTWDYGCTDFPIALAIYDDRIEERILTGGWLACIRCAHLVDTGKWDELVDRAVDHSPSKIPRTPESRDIIAITQAGFQANRTGEKVPFG